MSKEPMTLVERLRNPAWMTTDSGLDGHVPRLEEKRTIADMRDAADSIEMLLSGIPEVWDVNELRQIATGEKQPPFPFEPKDWRTGSIALLLHQAADEIDRLRALAGVVSRGESFADIKDKAKCDASAKSAASAGGQS